MKEFEDLQNLWNKQADTRASLSSEEIIKKAEITIKKVRQKHLWTIAVLCTTSAILITYFFWFSIYRLQLFALGLGMMAGVLLLRSAVEWWSHVRLAKVKSSLPLLDYTESMQRFYLWRKKIHFIFTPIIYVLYFSGFVIALPELEPYVSKGMYWYIIISGTLFCVGFASYIFREAKKEIKTLEFLKGIK
jgi:hypothetical protein